MSKTSNSAGAKVANSILQRSLDIEKKQATRIEDALDQSALEIAEATLHPARLALGDLPTSTVFEDEVEAWAYGPVVRKRLRRLSESTATSLLDGLEEATRPASMRRRKTFQRDVECRLGKVQAAFQALKPGQCHTRARKQRKWDLARAETTQEDYRQRMLLGITTSGC